jgi:hypothetical protein
MAEESLGFLPGSTSFKKSALAEHLLSRPKGWMVLQFYTMDRASHARCARSPVLPPTIRDMEGISHTVQVSAATLYEAVALGLRAVRTASTPNIFPIARPRAPACSTPTNSQRNLQHSGSSSILNDVAPYTSATSLTQLLNTFCKCTGGVGVPQSTSKESHDMLPVCPTGSLLAYLFEGTGFTKQYSRDAGTPALEGRGLKNQILSGAALPDGDFLKALSMWSIWLHDE